jgi:hypothetical protein
MIRLFVIDFRGFCVVCIDAVCAAVDDGRHANPSISNNEAPSTLLRFDASLFASSPVFHERTKHSVVCLTCIYVTIRT